MTVETSIRKMTFAGGQSVLTFTFRTLVDHPEYIKVKKVLISTGAETDLTYNSDFTVSVSADGIGGTVTISPTFSTSYNYLVYRDTDIIQGSDYDDFNQFPANTLEENLDQLTMIAQEQQEEISRSINFSISSTASTSIVFPSPVSNNLIGWNSAATALENKVASSTGTLILASTADAQTATNDTNYMTPAKVKTEVEFPGAVSIPRANIQADPVFRVHRSASFVITSGATTNVQYNVEDIDTHNYYDTTTFRYTPQVAGYYSLFNYVDYDMITANNVRVDSYVYKNGSPVNFQTHNFSITGSTDNIMGVYSQTVAQLNGSTDYVEFFTFQRNTGNVAQSGSTNSYAGGFLVSRS